MNEALTDTAATAQIIDPDIKDLGGFSVRRVLPSPRRRMVGPFIFFDHFGPAEFAPGDGIQVRPHPHIGLSTVTYLFEGEIIHRDGLGFVQPIQARAVNLMTAGRGIVHSERAGDDLHKPARLHGIQTWMALPVDQEECEPEFIHYPEKSLPELVVGDVNVRVIIGEAYGRRSPVKTYASTLYLECRMPAGSALTAPGDYEEIGLYVIDGQIRTGGRILGGGTMAVARSGMQLDIEADPASHVMILGGANPGKRHIWWNLVSSSRERIEQAKADWLEKRFDMVPGDNEFIPLPD